MTSPHNKPSSVGQGRTSEREPSHRSSVLGIHHVTAIASDPQRNIDFYVGLLGLRFVKRTVNFDDPQTYHFYFGDEAGNPGSILTFFPWPGARRGRQGTGQVAVTSFAAVPGALGFWTERLVHHGVAFEGPAARAAGGASPEKVIAFKDPDGLMLEIVVTTAAAARPTWGGAPGIPVEHALHGFYSVTLWEEAGGETERLLVDTMGFRAAGEDATTRRYAVGDGGRDASLMCAALAGSLEAQAAPGRSTTSPGACRTIRPKWRCGRS